MNICMYTHFQITKMNKYVNMSKFENGKRTLPPLEKKRAKTKKQTKKCMPLHVPCMYSIYNLKNTDFLFLLTSHTSYIG